MIINNREEYLEFWPYENKASCKRFPKEYPCFCERVLKDCGIMGDFWEIEIIYIPKDLKSDREIEIFLRGIKRQTEIDLR